MGGSKKKEPIEANPIYTTCFFSNLYLGGLRDFDSLEHGYNGLSAAGIQVIHDMAAGVDRDARAGEKPSDHVPVWVRLAA